MKEIYEEATNQSKMMCEAQKEEIFNNTLKENKKVNQEIERLNKALDTAIEIIYNKHKEILILNNIINEFDDFITNVDSHINLGDESEEFILVRDKWLELQELKGSDKE